MHSVPIVAYALSIAQWEFKVSVAWVGAGIAAVGVVSNIASAKSAANAQQDATNASIAAQQSSQDKALAAQQPFLDAGYAGVNRLQELLGIGGNSGAAGYGSLNKPFVFDRSNLASDPGYQFQLQQGQQALDRKAAAGGGFYSGAGLQGAAAFNQNLAGTTFNDAYNRQLNAYQTNRANTLNPLQSLAGQGQSAANTTSGLQTSGANSLAGLLTSNANAQGAAGIAQSNSLTNGLNQGLTAWQRAQYLNTPSTDFSAFSSNVANPNSGVGYQFPGDGNYSDERLKTNIRPIGKTARGNMIYAWDWKTGGSDEGVLAQEVMHIPGAVHSDADGLLMVDYSKV